MRLRIKLLLILAIIITVGCVGGVSFTPYDYKHKEGAKVKVDDSPYSINICGKELFLKKELGVQK